MWHFHFAHCTFPSWISLLWMAGVVPSSHLNGKRMFIMLQNDIKAKFLLINVLPPPGNLSVIKKKSIIINTVRVLKWGILLFTSSENISLCKLRFNCCYTAKELQYGNLTPSINSDNGTIGEHKHSKVMLLIFFLNKRNTHLIFF